MKFLCLALAGLGFAVFWGLLRKPGHRTLCLALLGASSFLLIDRHSGLLLLGLSLLAFPFGRSLAKAESHRTALLWSAVLFCAFPLGFFKYGPGILVRYDKAYIPLGISFYTFRLLHYLVECHRKTLPRHGLASFLAYMCFLPILISGPIERFPPFLEQCGTAAFRWDRCSEGLQRILRGLFRKLAADMLLAPLIPAPYWLDAHGLDLPWYRLVLLGFLRFLHTYLDFSGYTDIALGLGLLFGIRLMENFNNPLATLNPAAFWRTWHISLSTLARDYVYFPLLALTRVTWFPLLASMLAIGLWHGANRGWILWGLHHGCGLVLWQSFHQATRHSERWQRIRQSPAWKLCSWFLLFGFVSLAYLLTLPTRNSLSLYLRALGFSP